MGLVFLPHINIDKIKSNVLQRLLTGAGLVAMITSLLWAGHLGLLTLLLLLNIFGLQEFYHLFTSPAITCRKTFGVLVSSVFLVICHLVMFGVLNNWMVLFIIPVVFLLFVVELFLKSAHPFTNIAFTFLGIISLTFPLLFFDAIAFVPFGTQTYHYQILLGYFFILWAGDSGAFFIGKAVGTHKLFERISPGKTWEGSIGGALCALAVAFLNAQVFQEYGVMQWQVIAFLIILAGTFGDLIKSMMKRSLHVKDSGTILPGHGGILDRFDTLLGSAPFVFLYLFWFHYE